jgi:hypothetical protein
MRRARSDVSRRGVRAYACTQVRIPRITFQLHVPLGVTPPLADLAGCFRRFFDMRRNETRPRERAASKDEVKEGKEDREGIRGHKGNKNREIAAFSAASSGFGFGSNLNIVGG